MAAARSIHVRLDAEASAALDEVAGSDLTPSQAVRLSLEEAAARRRLRNEVAADARRLSRDPEYRAEMDEVQEIMEDIRAPW